MQLLWTLLSTLGTAASSSWSWATRGGNWKLAVAAITAVALAMGFISYRNTKAKLASTQASLAASQGEVALLRTARTADSSALSGAASGRVRIAAKETNDIKHTKAALSKHRDWADEPVPNDVLDSLR